ncbi:Zn-dependent exopeptidase [Hygrophoropsis aurantiaca]|uniref:Zn-dependent exopeptidase n=1 Tax=Hygrophoropsis aurantiaca TaxID=72124 RepID=A0ACB8ARQ5_9AGAM|nr:Zn-dependent exopeptidase [Hygrophoropsis aurantiaca]
MDEKNEKAGFRQNSGEILPHPANVPNKQPRRRLQLGKALIFYVATVFAIRFIYATKHANDGRLKASYDRSHSYDSYLKRIEDNFLSVPNNDSALAASRAYATHPHIAGAPEDFSDAEDILALFQTEFGITPPSTAPVFSAGTPESRSATLGITSGLKKPSVWVDTYYPVMNTAKSEDLSVQLLGDNGEVVWTADLIEDGDERDETAAKYRDAVPPFHGLSAPGEASGQLVYVNYGTKADYDKLLEAGVDFKGKIVLARYGANFRGLKVQGAEALGAVGVLIYSDPRDDGPVTVENGYEPYPAGPARNPTSIQRGSVMYLSTYPGDPTTPGYPAYENATRVEGWNVPHTPSLPLSWANAKLLFEQELGGVEEGRKLNGKVGSRKVKLANNVDVKVMPIWNTMAAIPGHISDEVVILGCHRDAWVMGAADPTSGTVSLHEVIRGLGALVRRGWKPLRTIVIASWDAEEYGLVGSTEWAEDFADWIQAHAVSYINVDVSVSGSRWVASASPSMAHLIERSAKDVAHPTDAGRSLWDAQNDVGHFTGPMDEEFAHMYEKSKDYPNLSTVGPLGSGSDYTVFLQRLGVASVDQGFGSTPFDAPYHYHSIYDSQKWEEDYADPGFHRHVAVAKSLGLLTLRFANSIVLPLNTTQYARELDAYVDLVEKSALSDSVLPDLAPLRKAVRKLQHASHKLDVEKVKAEKAFRKALKKIIRKKHLVRRILKWVKDHLGIGKDVQGCTSKNGKQFQEIMGMMDTVKEGPDVCQHIGKGPICKFIKAGLRVRQVNKKLASFERGFISEGGIKDREWYRHLGVAPGKYLGYGATTLPALSEAVVYEKNATLASFEADRLTYLIGKLAQDLKV